MANEKGFRPQKLNDFSGQGKAKKMLEIYIKAAKMKNETLDHVLIAGPSGTGKTTLANIIANECGKELKVYSGPAVKKIEDMIDILASVKEGDMIFIDEIHALSRKVQEQLYFACEQFVVDVNDDGESNRMEIPHFTCIGATTDLGGLEEPCRNRFPIHINLVQYDNHEMSRIIKDVCKSMKIDIDDECANMIGECSRGVPRNANSYMRRVYDFALVMNDGKITKKVIEDAFDFMDINRYGLNRMDMDYLNLLYEAKKPIGIDSIAMALGTDKGSVETVVEPYLVRKKLVMKSLRGRTITKDGVKIVKDTQK